MAPTVDALRQALNALSLDSRGRKDVLQKRLAKATKAKTRSASPVAELPLPDEKPPTRPPGELYDSFDSFLCFDVEATCENMPGAQGKAVFSYPNEIIEFPVILLQWRRHDSISAAEELVPAAANWRLEVVAEYRSFVRPTWRPKLSEFCTDLTGIYQAQVDAAPTYPQMLQHFARTFIKKYDLFTRDNKTVWVCDGPWDFRDFIAKASFLSRTPRPAWLAGEFIDLRFLAASFFSQQDASRRQNNIVDVTRATSSIPEDDVSHANPTDAPILDADALESDATVVEASPGEPSYAIVPPSSLSLPSVLIALGLPPFIGRLHSGLSDARNAARILIELQRRGMPMKANRCVPLGKERRYSWMGRRGEVHWEEQSRANRED